MRMEEAEFSHTIEKLCRAYDRGVLTQLEVNSRLVEVLVDWLNHGLELKVFKALIRQENYEYLLASFRSAPKSCSEWDRYRVVRFCSDCRPRTAHNDSDPAMNAWKNEFRRAIKAFRTKCGSQVKKTTKRRSRLSSY